MYDLAALESALAGSMYAGKLHFLSTTGSTNQDAMHAARSGAPHGSVFFADEQTAGRGRGGHAWHSAAGEGLYVSTVFRLPIPAARLPLLPLVAGLAAAEAIRIASGLLIDLRWPNDLLIGARKTGGILVEAGSQAAGPPHAVVGIGINVHQRSFDPSLATPATSLDMESGVPGDRSSSLGWKSGVPGDRSSSLGWESGVPGDRSSSLGWKSGRTIDRQQLLVAVLQCLECETRKLLDPAASAAIPARLAAASTWMEGRNVLVHGPQACSGITEGLDENGFLLVRTADGLVKVQTGGIRDANL